MDIIVKPFLEGLPRCAAIAHRGGARAYPENTLVAFEHALSDHRMDVLELDVQRTKDGVLVVADLHLEKGSSFAAR